jgi:hypothetical protein
MPHRLWDFVAERAGYQCEYCLAPQVLANHRFDVDHVQPRARGGVDHPDNQALACRACNGAKHAAITARDPVSRRLVRLFDPRTNVWDDHFELDVDTAAINGRTDIGRASVRRLRMNDRKALEARQFWILYFGFPGDPRDVGE